jgi:Na+:H+ antiporter, NhaC family
MVVKLLYSLIDLYVPYPFSITNNKIPFHFHLFRGTFTFALQRVEVRKCFGGATMNIEQKYNPHLAEAIAIVVALITIITISLSLFNSVPHIPILLCIIGLLFYGVVRGIKINDLEKSMFSAASSGIGAIYIFLLIGILISSWMIGGTIPTLVYVGFTLVSASFFYAIVFLVTSIIGTAIGSSLTTVATVGVAMMGIAVTVDASLAITAGAIVSGAFFGDKMSPLSDTTNLAASVVGIDIFTHIRNMMYSTIPAFVISLIIYAVLSPSGPSIDHAEIKAMKEALLTTNLVHTYTIIPLLVLVVCVIFKVPSLLTLIISAISSIVISYFHMALPMEVLFSILYNGYTSTIGVESIDAILSRGGMSSMYFTIVLILLSLSMGGLLFALGIVQTLLEAISHLLSNVGKAITGAAFTAIGINFLIGEQYLSIVLTGEAFKEKFRELRLHPKNLSRTMEDAGTVINPLVPWSVCGLFIATALSVPVMSYIPFAFFCLLSPIITILFGWLNITISKD